MATQSALQYCLTFTHSCTHSHRRRSQTFKVTACWSGAVRVMCLAQGHLDTQLGGAGEWTRHLPVTSQPALPPELQAAGLQKNGHHPLWTVWVDSSAPEHHIQHQRSLACNHNTSDRPALFRRPPRPAPVSHTVHYSHPFHPNCGHHPSGTQTRAGLWPRLPPLRIFACWVFYIYIYLYLFIIISARSAHSFWLWYYIILYCIILYYIILYYIDTNIYII